MKNGINGNGFNSYTMSCLKNKITEILEAHNFDIGYCMEDWDFMLLTGAIIDIIKFDDELHKKYGEYENSKLSMKDIMGMEFNEDEFKLIELGITGC